jgi:RHH-type rel operon transcriptional repressor/antitoxin RelB
MDPLLEKELELAAKRQGITKSQFIVDAVERALGRRDPAQLLHQVQEEVADYKVTSKPAPPSPLQTSLREKYAAQQSDYEAFLRTRKPS